MFVTRKNYNKVKEELESSKQELELYKAEFKDSPVQLTPTQNFEEFANTLVAQFSSFTATDKAMFVMGKFLFNSIKKAQERDYPVLVSRLIDSLKKHFNDDMKG